MPHPLEALSPLDGRYENKADELRGYFSEFALFGYRLHVEIEWLIFLCNTLKLTGTQRLAPADVRELRSLVRDFDGVAAERIKDFEKTTQHDVKALEYFIRENTAANPRLRALQSWVHFAATSEDVNNLALLLALRDFVEAVYTPLLTGVVMELYDLAKRYKAMPMLARTHGQPASPTTLGKEFINYVTRLEDQLTQVSLIPWLGKWNGATGNFNAHTSAFPTIDWLSASKKFVQQLGLEPNMYSTQIHPYDLFAARCHAVSRINSILIDLSRDVWTYISLGYFKVRKAKGQVGSSTMPHKVNPIDFENAEGNLGLANAIFEHFAQKLPISRLQRDLSDSTVVRNTGVAFGHSVLAYKNCIAGLQKLQCDEARVKADLEDHWELLAEPIQTVLRSRGMSNAYEQLQKLSQGKAITKTALRAFIRTLKIPTGDRNRLLRLTPESYTGLATKLVETYRPRFLRR